MAAELDLKLVPGAVEFAVKVVPGSSRSQIVGLLGEALKLAVAAPPEGGKANREVIQLLAALLGVKRGDVTIVQGHSQPRKRVRIAGVTPIQVRETLHARQKP